MAEIFTTEFNVGDSRNCADCGNQFTIEKEYNKVRCYECAKTRAQTYRKTNKAQLRNTRLYTHYKMTTEQFERMLSEQEYKCKLCKCALDESNAHVDHDHNCCKTVKTCGKCVRGLLCSGCNLGLGRLEHQFKLMHYDSEILLQRLTQYLSPAEDEPVVKQRPFSVNYFDPRYYDG